MEQCPLKTCCNLNPRQTRRPQSLKGYDLNGKVHNNVHCIVLMPLISCANIAKCVETFLETRSHGYRGHHGPPWLPWLPWLPCAPLQARTPEHQQCSRANLSVFGTSWVDPGSAKWIDACARSSAAVVGWDKGRVGRVTLIILIDLGCCCHPLVDAEVFKIQLYQMECFCTNVVGVVVLT